MLQSFKLLLPALIPSWNFFDVIADSPRIEYAHLSSPKAQDRAWREFRPRPAQVSPVQTLARLVWNPRWNEALFVVSCAERLLAEPTAHSKDEIFRRIAADLVDRGETDRAWLAFRIVLLSEQDGAIVRETAFVAEPRRLQAIAVR